MESVREKLQKIYEFYKKLSRENKISLTFVDFVFNNYSAFVIDENGSKIRSEFYKFIINTFGYNKPPKVLNAKDYKRLNRIELYHGYKSYRHGAEYLKEKDIFDYGYIPSGFYVSANKVFSYYYTGNFDSQNEANNVPDSARRILSMKLDTDKICHFSYIKDIRDKIHAGDFDNFPENDKDKILELLNFALTIEDENDRVLFVELFMENYSNIAVLLGYDAMFGGFAGFDEEDENNPEEIEIFNRAVVNVKESKYNWFLKNAELEKRIQKGE